MFMRTSKHAIVSSLIGACLITGCDRALTGDVPAGDRIDCGLGGSDFADTCTIEKGAGILTVHHPDGGFRRLVIDGHGTVSAGDGADALVSTKRPDGRIEVKVGQDRYIIGPIGAPASPR